MSTMTIVQSEITSTDIIDIIEYAREARDLRDSSSAVYEAAADELRALALPLRPAGVATIEIGSGCRVQWAQSYTPIDAAELDMLGQLADELTESTTKVAVRKDCDATELLARLASAGIDAGQFLDVATITAPRRGADERCARAIARGAPGPWAMASAIISAHQRAARVLL